MRTRYWHWTTWKGRTFIIQRKGKYFSNYDSRIISMMTNTCVHYYDTVCTTHVTSSKIGKRNWHRRSALSDWRGKARVRTYGDIVLRRRTSWHSCTTITSQSMDNERQWSSSSRWYPKNMRELEMNGRILNSVIEWNRDDIAIGTDQGNVREIRRPSSDS